MTSTQGVTPFQVAWSEADMSALLKNVSEAVIPPAPEGAGWSLGCDRDFLVKFRDYWVKDYDWRAAMAELNRYPQFTAEIDGLSVHFLHVKGEGANPRPLIMTHGWPGSIYEFYDVIDKLTHPSKYGGRAEDAFTLVMPSLPGYGFSGKPTTPIGPRAIANMWNTLMTQVLGYETYLAQGGDWGSFVTSMLGLEHGGPVKAIHLNMLALRNATPPQNEEEVAWFKVSEGSKARLSGYSALQMMKPMSLSFLSAGNPLGQAAWILERFHDWSDLREGDLEDVYGLDHLITNIMIYVMNDAFQSSIWLYNGMFPEKILPLPEGVKCETPTGYAAFPMDHVAPLPPRSRVELTHNLVHWTPMDKGGHFAAMEQPDLFAGDVFDWAAKVWPV